MQTGESVSCVLWLSQLSPACDLGVVKQIWQSSRRTNSELGLTGAMVFDGERFCELLEGDAHAILAACQGIETDPRHVGPKRLHVSPSPAPRRLNNWRSGYCDSTELDVFSGDGALEGEAALTAFLALLSRCELLA